MKLKKSIWLPGVLLIYLVAMTAVFAGDLIAGGEWLRLVSVVLVELLMIIALHILLKKKEMK